MVDVSADSGWLFTTLNVMMLMQSIVQVSEFFCKYVNRNNFDKKKKLHLFSRAKVTLKIV